MKSEILSDLIDFNPPLKLGKEIIAQKVAMEHVQPKNKFIYCFEEATFRSGCKFQNNDTLLARITPCLENGKTAFVDFLSDEKQIAFGSTEFIVMRAKKGKCTPQFVYYLATSPNFRDSAIKSMVGSSGRQRVQIDVIKNLILPIPNLQTQKKIGRFLSLLDEKIRLNKQINDNLEQQAEAFFQYFFIDNANVDWKEGVLSDLGTIVGGSTPSKAKAEYYTTQGIAWITPKDLSINRSKFISHGENDITELGLKNSSASIMPEGTVLFSSRAPIGYIAIAASRVTTNQGFKSVIPNVDIGTAFIYYFLKHNLPIIEGMASGSTFKEVSGNTMKFVPAFIPDKDTLKKFSDLCASIFAQQRILEEQNQSLAVLRDTLLPKLMSGEIDVSGIEI